MRTLIVATPRSPLRLFENRVIRVYQNGREEKCAERSILSIALLFFVFILHWSNCAKYSRFSVDSGILHP